MTLTGIVIIVIGLRIILKTCTNRSNGAKILDYRVKVTHITKVNKSRQSLLRIS